MANLLDFLYWMIGSFAVPICISSLIVAPLAFMMRMYKKGLICAGISLVLGIGLLFANVEKTTISQNRYELVELSKVTDMELKRDCYLIKNVDSNQDVQYRLWYKDEDGLTMTIVVSENDINWNFNPNEHHMIEIHSRTIMKMYNIIPIFPIPDVKYNISIPDGSITEMNK